MFELKLEFIEAYLIMKLIEKDSIEKNFTLSDQMRSLYNKLADVVDPVLAKENA